MNTPESCVARAADWFAQLTQASLASIRQVYASDAHFKDPFNDVIGVDHIQAIYAHMFVNLTNPKFEITQIIEQAKPVAASDLNAPVDQQQVHAFVAWLFTFQWRGQQFEIPGGTRFAFDRDGLITDHVDYWDVAEGLYEKLPLIGRVLRMLRKRMGTPVA